MANASSFLEHSCHFRDHKIRGSIRGVFVGE
jgi:hypothetical protein